MQCLSPFLRPCASFEMKLKEDWRMTLELVPTFRKRAPCTPSEAYIDGMFIR